jgi:uncharacterized repeat protein (TIGR01451 family)
MHHHASQQGRGDRRPPHSALSKALLLTALMSSGVLLKSLPAFAAGATAGIDITNQASGSFLDTSDNATKTIISNEVKVTVAEITGITVQSEGNSGAALSGNAAYFDFKVTNNGNDPTQFFIPGAPSTITGATAGTVQIVGYVTPTGTVNNLSTPVNIPSAGAVSGTLSDPTLGGNVTGGSIPADAALIVRVNVTVTASSSQPVSVTLGNTTGSPQNQNTPFIANTNDLYTVDNSGTANGDAVAGAPFNGDATNHRQEASVSQSLTASGLSVTGRVWNDADGSVALNAPEAGTNTGTANNLTVYAVGSNGLVAAVATVANDGTYTLNNLFANASYTLRLSTDNTVAVGGTAPTAASLPAGWTNTGENKAGTTETTTPGEIAISLGTAGIADQDFGIEQLPTVNAVSSASQVNPIGNGQVQVPTLTGNDPEDGALGQGSTFKILTLPTNATLYYNGVAITTAGTVISNYDPTLLRVDPVDGAVTVSFTYAAIDNAGKEGVANTVTMPFSAAPAQVLLVKRITAINGVRTANPNDPTKVLNTFVDDTTSSKQAEDNHPNWPANFLRGELNAGLVKPGDTIEYTVYFMNAQGSDAQNLQICDRVIGSQTFQTAAYGTNDLELQMGNAAPIGLTGANDSSDRGQFIANSSTAPTSCNLPILPSGQADNGTVVFGVTGTGSSVQPDWTTLPGASSAGNPTTSYGFVRFTTRVN